jgi:hypothetical protein
MTRWNSGLALLGGAEQPLRDIIIVMRDTGMCRFLQWPRRIHRGRLCLRHEPEGRGAHNGQPFRLRRVYNPRPYPLCSANLCSNWNDMPFGPNRTMAVNVRLGWTSP